MNPDHIRLQPRDEDALGIAIARTSYGNTHTGVVHRGSDGRHWLFHQAFHYETRNDLYDQARLDMGGPCLCVFPGIEPERARAVAGFVRFIASLKEPIGYALRFDPDAHFDDTTGKLVLPNGKGLSCSTFVLVLFRSARLPLIDTTGWPTNRLGDREAQEGLVRVLEKLYGTTDATHVAAVRAEIGCERIRPEEVASAAMYDTLPVRFRQIEPAAQLLLQRLNVTAPQT